MTNSWVEVNSATDSVWSREKPIEGVYIEKKEGVGRNDSIMYHIKTDKEVVGVWGSTVLDTKFSSIPLNSEVRIEPKGEQVGKSGTKYLDFSVFYRPAPMQEVGKVETANDEPLPEEPPIEEVDLNSIPFN